MGVREFNVVYADVEVQAEQCKERHQQVEVDPERVVKSVDLGHLVPNLVLLEVVFVAEAVVSGQSTKLLVFRIQNDI